MGQAILPAAAFQAALSDQRRQLAACPTYSLASVVVDVRGTQRTMSNKQPSFWYPIELPLRYESVGHNPVKGVGRTIAIKSKAVRFATNQDLKAGLKLSLAISWPAQLPDGTGLNLAISGFVARSELGAVELIVARHEFRTRSGPLQRAAGGSWSVGIPARVR